MPPGKSKRRSPPTTSTKAGPSKTQAERPAQGEDECADAFSVPERTRWSNPKDLKHDIGAELHRTTEVVEEHNATLEGVAGFQRVQHQAVRLSRDSLQDQWVTL